MQHVPSCEIRVSIAAQPGSGPNGYTRVIRAPAMYTGWATPGTLEACTSLAEVIRLDIAPSTGPGSQASTGPSSPTASTDACARAWSTNRRTAWTRAAGSGSASGPGSRAPVNRLPPCGSSSVRRLIGMPTGIVSGTATPSASW